MNNKCGLFGRPLKNKTIIAFVLLLLAATIIAHNVSGTQGGSVVTTGDLAAHHSGSGESELASELDGMVRWLFVQMMSLNPTIYPVTGGLGNVIKANLQILIPAYELVILLLGMYIIFASLIPPRRAHAKGMFTKLLTGLVLVSLSPMIFQTLLELEKGLVDEIITEAGINTLSMSTAFAGLLALSFIWPFSCIMGPAVIIVLILTMIIFALRYLAVALLGALFPVSVFLYTFDYTKGIGAKLMRYSLIWIFTPVVQTIFFVVMVESIKSSLSSIGSLLGGPMMGITALTMMAAAPLMMTKFMGLIGGAVYDAGMARRNLALMSFGNIMRGQGPGAIHSAAYELATARVREGSEDGRGVEGRKPTAVPKEDQSIGGAGSGFLPGWRRGTGFVGRLTESMKSGLFGSRVGAPTDVTTVGQRARRNWEEGGAWGKTKAVAHILARPVRRAGALVGSVLVAAGRYDYLGLPPPLGDVVGRAGAGIMAVSTGRVTIFDHGRSGGSPAQKSLSRSLAGRLAGKDGRGVKGRRVGLAVGAVAGVTALGFVGGMFTPIGVAAIAGTVALTALAGAGVGLGSYVSVTGGINWVSRRTGRNLQMRGGGTGDRLYAGKFTAEEKSLFSQRQKAEAELTRKNRALAVVQGKKRGLEDKKAGLEHKLDGALTDRERRKLERPIAKIQAKIDELTQTETRLKSEAAELGDRVRGLHDKTDNLSYQAAAREASQTAATGPQVPAATSTRSAVDGTKDSIRGARSADDFDVDAAKLEAGADAARERARTRETQLAAEMTSTELPVSAGTRSAFNTKKTQLDALLGDSSTGTGQLLESGNVVAAQRLVDSNERRQRELERRAGHFSDNPLTTEERTELNALKHLSGYAKERMRAAQMGVAAAAAKEVAEEMRTQRTTPLADRGNMVKAENVKTGERPEDIAGMASREYNGGQESRQRVEARVRADFDTQAGQRLAEGIVKAAAAQASSAKKRADSTINSVGNLIAERSGGSLSDTQKQQVTAAGEALLEGRVAAAKTALRAAGATASEIGRVAAAGESLGRANAEAQSAVRAQREGYHARGHLDASGNPDGFKGLIDEVHDRAPTGPSGSRLSKKQIAEGFHRAIEKVEDGSMTSDQAKQALEQRFGFTEDEAKRFVDDRNFDGLNERGAFTRALDSAIENDASGHLGSAVRKTQERRRAAAELEAQGVDPRGIPGELRMLGLDLTSDENTALGNFTASTMDEAENFGRTGGWVIGTDERTGEVLDTKMIDTSRILTDHGVDADGNFVTDAGTLIEGGGAPTYETKSALDLYQETQDSISALQEQHRLDSIQGQAAGQNPMTSGMARGCTEIASNGTDVRTLLRDDAGQQALAEVTGLSVGDMHQMASEPAKAAELQAIADDALLADSGARAAMAEHLETTASDVQAAAENRKLDTRVEVYASERAESRHVDSLYNGVRKEDGTLDTNSLEYEMLRGGVSTSRGLTDAQIDGRIQNWVDEYTEAKAKAETLGDYTALGNIQRETAERMRALGVAYQSRVDIANPEEAARVLSGEHTAYVRGADGQSKSRIAAGSGEEALLNSYRDKVTTNSAGEAEAFNLAEERYRLEEDGRLKKSSDEHNARVRAAEEFEESIMGGSTEWTEHVRRE